MFLDNPSVPTSRVKQSMENAVIMGLAVQEGSIPLGMLNPQRCTDRLCQNVSTELPFYAA